MYILTKNVYFKCGTQFQVLQLDLSYMFTILYINLFWIHILHFLSPDCWTLNAEIHD